MERLAEKTYISNGCVVTYSEDDGAIVVIYVPKNKKGQWVSYADDNPQKAAPSWCNMFIF